MGGKGTREGLGREKDCKKKAGKEKERARRRRMGKKGKEKIRAKKQ